MKKIERILQNTLNKEWNGGKIILVLGPRQVGKTTLIKEICDSKGDYLFINGDDIEDKQLLLNAGETKLKQIIGQHKTIFIDEAQRINDICITLKIIHDRMPSIQVVISGSSALELSNSVNEALTGRKWEHLLFPISWQEMINYFGYIETHKNLSHHLIFGLYPEIVMNPLEAEKRLKELANSYLYKDLLQYQKIRKPEVLDKLLIALALQIGSEVNYNELANTLRIDRATIEQYISLLEKAFIVFRLQPLSKNVRTEISTNRKIYFYDNGIRNAIIRNFTSLELRNDVGALWENFLVAEKMKARHYSGWNGRAYYWRTYAQQEIDYVEESNGNYSSYEFKWSAKQQAKFPITFLNAYKPIEKQVVTPENMGDFLL
jgi:hypothetical protein